jgi:hypothetical protein
MTLLLLEANQFALVCLAISALSGWRECGYQHTELTNSEVDSQPCALALRSTPRMAARTNVSCWTQR